ncbi:hypothetical protein PR202_ga06904 [Eleusine coracana subsp. coracana]|uniref:Uncharacterized protein n=1 Tax=Eleusine coracana subsp. coracana TaxID=191504 RepID=A0AAV5BXX6_ELECO|nr:hypothetical protein PR202_ga06904 [Eleusine coracana subsp. coracana]
MMDRKRRPHVGYASLPVCRDASAVLISRIVQQHESVPCLVSCRSNDERPARVPLLLLFRLATASEDSVHCTLIIFSVFFLKQRGVNGPLGVKESPSPDTAAFKALNTSNAVFCQRTNHDRSVRWNEYLELTNGKSACSREAKSTRPALKSTHAPSSTLSFLYVPLQFDRGNFRV